MGAVAVLDRVRDGRVPATTSGSAHYRVRLPALEADADLAARAGARVVVPGRRRVAGGARRPGRPGAAGPLGRRRRRTSADVARRSGGGGRGPGLHAVRRARGRRARRRAGRPGLDRRVRRRVRHRRGRAPRARWPSTAPTVAVLACGVDVAYPAAHDGLLARGPRRAARSCPSCRRAARPTRRRFLDRNRVIAALARGTVVVEAAIRSGALQHGRARRGAVPRR